LALAVLAADQWTKHWVRHNLLPGIPFDPLPGLRPLLSLTYVTNTGASFGLFPQLKSFYVVVNLAVISMILLFHRRLPPSQWLLASSLGLLLGGSAGNVIDRLWHGWVIDFIDLNFWPLQEWPVFNVADSSTVVGVCILSVYLLLHEEPTSAASEVPPRKEPDAS
jgi:signal peptidase II